MKLIVGLGNPGTQYQKTRHNVGFIVVDEIFHHGFFSENWQKKFNGLTVAGEIEGQKVLLLKPETFMNLSGQAVVAACSFFKIPPSDVIVIQDDIDLPLGKIRVKQGGSSAGHNGIKSIDAAIGPDYHRIRIGVGRPEGPMDVADYVLSAFSKEQLDQIHQEITPQVLAELQKLI